MYTAVYECMSPETMLWLEISLVSNVKLHVLSFVDFNNFQTKFAVMCKIYEQDDVSMLKRILCSF
jgi:hypothetical protein